MPEQPTIHTHTQPLQDVLPVRIQPKEDHAEKRRKPVFFTPELLNHLRSLHPEREITDIPTALRCFRDAVLAGDLPIHTITQMNHTRDYQVRDVLGEGISEHVKDRWHQVSFYYLGNQELSKLITLSQHPELFSQLSKREQLFIAGILEGKTVAQIASDLNVGVGVITNRLSRLMDRADMVLSGQPLPELSERTLIGRDDLRRQRREAQALVAAAQSHPENAQLYDTSTPAYLSRHVAGACLGLDPLGRNRSELAAKTPPIVLKTKEPTEDDKRLEREVAVLMSRSSALSSPSSS